MKLVSEGYPFIIGLPVIGAVLGGLCLFGGWSVVAYAFFFLGLVGLAFMLWFFRDPERTPPARDDAVVSGADGTVRRVERLEAVDGFEGAVTRISVYLTPWDVHVNRIPLGGTVAHTSYVPGKRLLTASDAASEWNEHSVVAVQGPVRCVVHQIVGPVVRRVVYWLQTGEPVQTGGRLGLMKFGSRLDVYLPADAVEVTVQPGEHVRAGESIIATLKAADVDFTS